MNETTVLQAPSIIRDQDILEGYSNDALCHAIPEGLVRPKDAREVCQIMQYCSHNNIPVTACGHQTSLTGASVTI